MISIRKEIHKSQQLAECFAALLKVFLDVVAAVPKAALPADPGLFAECGQKVEEAAAPLKGSPAVAAIQSAGNLSLHQIDQICATNQAAFEERDGAIKDVVALVAKVISGIKCDGERQNFTLARLAEGFESLSHIDDFQELRRRLKDDVQTMRKTVDQMRRDNEDAVRRFEADVSAFERRLEMARKDSGTDRLTGLGGRRAADLFLKKMAASEQPISLLLFDIEGFRKINEEQGTLFGDKVLQALAHQLCTRFAENAATFRWAADEFLVILEGQASVAAVQCGHLCSAFASNIYCVVTNGAKVPVRANVAFGVRSYVRGDSIGKSYRQVREALEQSREAVRV